MDVCPLVHTGPYLGARWHSVNPPLQNSIQLSGARRQLIVVEGSPPAFFDKKIPARVDGKVCAPRAAKEISSSGSRLFGVIRNFMSDPFPFGLAPLVCILLRSGVSVKRNFKRPNNRRPIRLCPAQPRQVEHNPPIAARPARRRQRHFHGQFKPCRVTHGCGFLHDAPPFAAMASATVWVNECTVSCSSAEVT